MYAFLLLVSNGPVSSITVYKSRLNVGDDKNKAGLHLDSSEYSPWSGESMTLCLRANLGLLGHPIFGGVNPVQISGVFSEDEVSPIGVFLFSAAAPHPFIGFGSSGTGQRTSGSEA